MLTIGSLFSGIGGLELGLEWAGLGPVLWQVEKDEFCRRVLAKHWPDVPRWNDVETVRAAQLPVVDLICGGFPCQDVSSTGRGAGLKGARSRLWWNFANIVAHALPHWVVVENVASGVSRWLRPVRHHLHMLGYRTRALGIGAVNVGAPHQRRRIFVVAHSNRFLGSPRDGHQQVREGEVFRSRESRRDSRARWALEDCPGQGRVADGLPTWLDNARVKALGNAVVPQCAQVVGEVIRQMLGAS